MLYRIDIQHFLSHMIDYFTVNEILHFQWMILSAAIRTQDRISNVAKVNILYPPNELVTRYAENPNQKVFEGEYFEMLDSHATEGQRNMTWSEGKAYELLIQPLLNHVDIVLICDEKENYILDAFCKYIKKWHIETIDLNALFKTGHIGPITIDRDKIRDSAVDLRRAAGRDNIAALESTSGGRYKLLGMMSKKEKLEKLKELGVIVRDTDKKVLDELLIESWVNDEELND